MGVAGGLASRFQEDLVWRVGLLPADVPAFLATVDQQYRANETLARSGRRALLMANPSVDRQNENRPAKRQVT